MQEAEPPEPVTVETAADLDAAVEDHDRALAEFYTDGCGACAAMEPVLSIVTQETGVPVLLVNPRDDPALVEEYRITRVPTLVLFEDGEPARRLDDGFVGAERVIEFVGQ